jgi:hypothetical protein
LFALACEPLTSLELLNFSKTKRTCTQIDKERQDIALARLQLEEDQQKFAEETARVASVLSDSEQV